MVSKVFRFGTEDLSGGHGEGSHQAEQGRCVHRVTVEEAGEALREYANQLCGLVTDIGGSYDTQRRVEVSGSRGEVEKAIAPCSVEFGTFSKLVAGVSHFHPQVRDRGEKGRVDPKTLIPPVSLGLEFTLLGPPPPLPGPTHVFPGLLSVPAPIFTMSIDELACDHTDDPQQRHCQRRPERHLTTLHDRSLGADVLFVGCHERCFADCGHAEGPVAWVAGGLLGHQT
ncbi:hypothetical protein ED92_11235 [Amycolatopsis sp. MJM2582]|nr:hypothetical protein ED92_11235 [Amycolatopsis sp. MJM2582]